MLTETDIQITTINKYTAFWGEIRWAADRRYMSVVGGGEGGVNTPLLWAPGNSLMIVHRAKPKGGKCSLFE